MQKRSNSSLRSPIVDSLPAEILRSTACSPGRGGVEQWDVSEARKRVSEVTIPVGRESQQPVIGAELARELERYKGRWVAVDKGELVADGDSASEAKAAAEGKGHTDPMIFRVPTNPDRLAFF